MFAGSRQSEITVLAPILVDFIRLMNKKYNDMTYVFHSTKDYSKLLQSFVNQSDINNIEEIARNMNLEFSSENNKIFLDGIDVSNSIRTEEISIVSSKVAQLKSVRAILHGIQRGYLKGNGLIADGRDMGTVIFPDADLKIFITANTRRTQVSISTMA